MGAEVTQVRSLSSATGQLENLVPGMAGLPRADALAGAGTLRQDRLRQDGLRQDGLRQDGLQRDGFQREEVLSGGDILPVLPALRGLLTAGGLQRGQVVTTDGWGLLCLALAAGASADGAWCAAVGLPSLGVRAAVDAGLDPDRLLLIAEPGANWPQVVASLLDGCDIVLLRPSDRPPAQVRRKLEATARRHGSVLLVAGEWEGAPTRLRIAAQQWAGLGVGHGRLRARKARVAAEGRGAGARPRDTWLWLPGPDGTVTTVTTVTAVIAVTDADTAPERTALTGTALTGTALTGTALTGTALADTALAETAWAGTG
jgi:hypothetical protein